MLTHIKLELFFLLEQSGLTEKPLSLHQGVVELVLKASCVKRVIHLISPCHYLKN